MATRCDRFWIGSSCWRLAVGSCRCAVSWLFFIFHDSRMASSLSASTKLTAHFSCCSLLLRLDLSVRPKPSACPLQLFSSTGRSPPPCWRIGPSPSSPTAWQHRFLPNLDRIRCHRPKPRGGPHSASHRAPTCRWSGRDTDFAWRGALSAQACSCASPTWRLWLNRRRKPRWEGGASSRAEVLA